MAKIGFIGTGIMGQPMAANLQKAGHQLFLSEHHGKAPAELIAAGAVVTKDVPDHALMVGAPAKQAGWVCACGERVKLEGNRTACTCGRALVRGADGKVSQEG